MIRAVFDTNILYSAIRQPQGLPARAIDLVTSGLVLPCVSDAVLEEYRDVLLRPELDLHAERRTTRILTARQFVARSIRSRNGQKIRLLIPSHRRTI